MVRQKVRWLLVKLDVFNVDHHHHHRHHQHEQQQAATIIKEQDVYPAIKQCMQTTYGISAAGMIHDIHGE